MAKEANGKIGFKDRPVCEGTEASVKIKVEWWLRYMAPDLDAVDPGSDPGELYEHMERFADETLALNSYHSVLALGATDVRLRRHTTTATIVKEEVRVP